ncbi:tetratricopeptide repeat protein [Bradyrhizobium sp. USDA 4471]
MTSVSMAHELPPTGSPGMAELLRAGREHYRRGEIKPAIAAFQAGLALAATVSIGVAVDGGADLHAALANAFMLCDDIGSAAENYKAALRIAPHLVACWCNLGIVHQRGGRTQDAISLYLEALRRNPGHRPSRTNLVQALVTTRQFGIAKTLLLELLEETPEDADLRSQLGKLCFELGETGEAVAQFERAVALAPEQAQILLGRSDPSGARRVGGGTGRLRPRRTRASDPAPASNSIAAGVSGAGLVCALRRQHAGRISLQGLRLPDQYPVAVIR